MSDLDYSTYIAGDGVEIGVITLNRPEARNALTHGMYADLERLVREAEPSGIRCLVIAAADPVFCSGDDVRQVMGGGDQGRAPITSERNHQPRLTPAAGALLHTNVPVIAAVNGAAVGWGMELCLMADLRVASDRAKFGELFVLRGLVSDVAGIGRLAQLVGREKAAELLFTGEIIDALTARDIGLVSRVVPHDDLHKTAMDLACKIAMNPPLAVRKIKEGLRRALDPNWDDLGSWVSQTLGELFTTEDHREGVRSFLEKRSSRFTGH